MCMTNRPDSVQALKGGEYLLVNQRLFLHVPDLKLLRFRKMEDNIYGYHFIKTGGAQTVSPDKKSLAFIGGNYDANNKYHYAMITYDPFPEKAEVVPYSRTDTRSVDLNLSFICITPCTAAPAEDPQKRPSSLASLRHIKKDSLS